MEGDGFVFHVLSFLSISIHSLRVEGDNVINCFRLELLHFNPLPPSGGRRRLVVVPTPAGTFQSTPSEWRETIHDDSIIYTSDFNPLPPSGGRLAVAIVHKLENLFQSTPSEWRETYNYHYMFSTVLFQSTPSEWRETDRNVFICSHDVFQSTPSEWRET